VGGGGKYDAAWLSTCRRANNNNAGGAKLSLARKEERGRGEEVPAASSAAPVLRDGGVRGNTCQPQCAVSGGMNNGTTLQMFSQPYIPFTRHMFLDSLVIALFDQNIQNWNKMGGHKGQ
jgi:hypothetical protein